ncbi:MAG TPA: S-methyl-5-thioribose-1-phosphate isomerase [bacterium]|nr:S-methyl-5-thioribose-1-phosphate isomerase [bacterium]
MSRELNIARALWWENDTLHLLDQTQLPGKEVVLHIRDITQLIEAIKALSVRGAPALGIAGAYGTVLAASEWKDSSAAPDWEQLRQKVDPLISARPTAVNLEWAVKHVMTRGRETRAGTRNEAYRVLEQEAIALHRDDEERCRKIGEYGAELLAESGRVITHCNTGALATGGIGTALGVIYSAVMQGKSVHVYADETRPLLQGARLTAWELHRAGIPVTVMTDGMGAALMQQESINCVIVGADRIANNGDTANKIGTYHLAIAATVHNVPFYVAAPISTIDTSIADGNDIPIELRGEEEVLSWGEIHTSPEHVTAFAPAFDVTPAAYISAIVTDRGIASPPYDFRAFLQNAN